mmetsp:Transcript_36760/g.118232  ORF Transcript_36760/g.118232 Transcript_36760/m.118232 type:complete len:212 (+) Transcript_36760:889-1524(+)
MTPSAGTCCGDGRTLSCQTPTSFPARATGAAGATCTRRTAWSWRATARCWDRAPSGGAPASATAARSAPACSAPAASSARGWTSSAAICGAVSGLRTVRGCAGPSAATAPSWGAARRWKPGASLALGCACRPEPSCPPTPVTPRSRPTCCARCPRSWTKTTTPGATMRPRRAVRRLAPPPTPPRPAASAGAWARCGGWWRAPAPWATTARP